MNAQPLDGVSPAGDAKSLMDQCRHRRWSLLQQFACLEIALKRRLNTPTRTFGSKMKEWAKVEPATTKGFARLIDARNLVAHALVTPIQLGTTSYVLWEVAESTAELQCVKFDRAALKRWADDLDTLLKQAIAAAAA